MDQRLLLRPAEAGELLGIGRSTVYQLIDQGELPAVRLGRSVRIPVKALEELIDDQLRSQWSGQHGMARSLDGPPSELRRISLWPPTPFTLQELN